MKALLQRPIAHRGLHDNKFIVENTLESFNAAIKSKFPIECDIVLSKDEEVIVFHDYDLKRLANINKSIDNFRTDELRKINLLETKSVISSVDEVLHKVKGEVPILIEIKESFNCKIEERLFEIIRSYDGEIAIQSFDSKSIRWFKENAPFFKLGLVSRSTNLTIEEVNKLGVDFVSFDINILESDIVKKTKSMGFHILTWTVDTNEKYQKSLRFADNCIFQNIKFDN